MIHFTLLQTAFTISLLSLIFVGSLIVTNHFYKKDLTEFRAQLRPGYCVKMRTQTGRTIPVRILKKESSNIFVVQEIDNRTQHLTTVKNIFRP